jgi:NADPH2:quinone reductase
VRAAVCREYGGPEVVRVEPDFPEPVLRAGQARVRVSAAALNFPDLLVIANQYQMSVALPFVPGSEFAGVVTEVADGVTSIAAGDRVTGTCLVGAFADEVVVSADALAPVPAGVDDRMAAGFGVAHRTAYHVLRSIAQVQPGEELVVLGAGGGVGLAAVQLGAELDARVTAVASSAEKLQVAEQEGATKMVNRRSGQLRQLLRDAVPGGADVIIDPVGGDLAEPALRSLHWGGRFVTVGYASGTIPRIPLNLVLLKGVHILGFQFASFAEHAPDELRRNERALLELLATHRVRPHIGAVFGLEDVVGAMRVVADGRAIGKVIVEV